jgi:Acetyltransferase (GNAT) family
MKRRAMTVSDRLDQAEACYARLIAQYAKTPFESTDAEMRLAALIRDEAITELQTRTQRLFFARRSMSDTGITYRVFRTELSAIIGEEDIGYCEISRITNGICVIVNAEVARSYQRKGIATAVYDLIASDMTKVGGLLWPVSPTKMSDSEFKVWWRRSPALVFYYPQRYQLGLQPRYEFDELFDATLNRGIWEKGLGYWSMLLARIRRSAGFIGFRR